jgi:hypothetical protein
VAHTQHDATKQGRSCDVCTNELEGSGSRAKQIQLDEQKGDHEKRGSSFMKKSQEGPGSLVGDPQSPALQGSV